MILAVSWTACFKKKKTNNQNTKHRGGEKGGRGEKAVEEGGKGEGIILQVLGIMLKNSCHLLSAINRRKLPSHWSRFLPAPHPHPESA